MQKELIAAVVAVTAGFVAAPSLAADGKACGALNNVALSGGHVTSARAVAAKDGLPAYCQVRATALPAISMEIRLPLEAWNGKFYQAGCGGFCGILGRADSSAGWINAMRPGLERGYATATSDGGHHGLSVVDAAWADHNPNAERDWGWRSIGETNRIAKTLIEVFYGRAPEQAIFQGCSTGGRMAHVAAQRYPEMFQGIISGAPAMDYTGLVGTKMSWLMQANTGEEGQPILKPGKEQLIGDAVMKACDGIDGTVDGLIEDPRLCSADLSSLRCKGDAAGDCLTDAELSVVDKWRQPPLNSKGEELYPGGIPYGSEPFWGLWLTGFEKGGGKLVNAFASGFGAYMAFPDDPGASWAPQDFDFDADPGRMASKAEVYNGDNPDLSAFIAAGGKMIVWHGWSDAIVTPFKTVDWYEQASELAGGEEALKRNVALFMVPGLDHCGLQAGPTGLSQADLDPMTPLEAWLTDGTAPVSILATR